MGEYNIITVPPYVRQLLHPAFQARQTRVVLRCELFSRRLVPNVLGEPLEAYFAIAGMATSVFSPNAKGKRVPAELESAVTELRAGYSIDQHMQPSMASNEQIIDRVGVSRYLTDRFAFAGTPKELRGKKSRIEASESGSSCSTFEAACRNVRALADVLELSSA
jgi:hypothetical protein